LYAPVHIDAPALRSEPDWLSSRQCTRELYQTWTHADSLRYALFTLAPGYFFVAWYA
jgi:hypothetical protein